MTEASTDVATLEANKTVIRHFVEEVQKQKSEDAYGSSMIPSS
jgi:hypothetical protein